jgi:hypothetical protein
MPTKRFDILNKKGRLLVVSEIRCFLAAGLSMDYNFNDKTLAVDCFSPLDRSVKVTLLNQEANK